MNRVPVLCYHAVSDEPSAWIAGMSVTPRQFSAHVRTLLDLGRTPVGPAAVAAALTGGPPLPAGAVAITFDDGFAGVAEVAAPLLADAGIPAAVYVTTGVVGGHSPGGDRMLTWRQIEDLLSLGFEIGGHTHLHHQLDAVPRRVARADIVECRDRLQDRLGRPCGGFAHPHGYSDRAVRRLVAEAGFSYAYGVRNTLSAPTDDPFTVSRLTVTAGTGAARLAAWLDDRDLPPQPWPRPVLVAGWRAYRRARALRGHPSPWVAGMPAAASSDPQFTA
jgi:peptidoglycan/xylan/chitin deacetylase (PgdA/CDA1 family)